MIPVDGALAALRESMSGLAKLVNGNASCELYVSAIAAVECLAMAIEQAQSAERAAHPEPSRELVEALYQLRREALDGVSPERSRAIRARYTAVERALYTDPEHARVNMTPLDRLRVIAGLVQTLPHGTASHEVALGHSEPAFSVLCEAGATVTRNEAGTLLRATLHLDGVRFTAQRDGQS